MSSYDAALRLSANFAEALNGRGSALRALGRFAEADECLDKALTHRPGWSVAHNNRGNALKELGQYEAAMSNFEAAIASNPDDADAYCNRGVAYRELGHLERALADFARSTRIRPDFARAHLNTACTLLLQGDFASGWRLYEWRSRTKQSAPREKSHSLEAPLWLGEEPLAGKTILLHAEQGLGDTLQFCRYAPLIAALGARVIDEVPGPLKRLVASVAAVAQVCERGEALPHYDYQFPLMSLPLAQRTTVDTIPARVPYLRPDAGKVSEWKRRLGERVRPRVGLVWSGGNQPRAVAFGDPRRNIPLMQLAALRRPVSSSKRWRASGRVPSS